MSREIKQKIGDIRKNFGASIWAGSRGWEGHNISVNKLMITMILASDNCFKINKQKTVID